MPRKKQRKNNTPPISWVQTILPMLMLGLLISFSVWVWLRIHSPTTLPFKTVKIIAPVHHIQPMQLQNQITRHVHGGFFSLDIGTLKRSVHALPWVDSVSVRRVWPSTLVVRITERQPVARWNDDQLITQAGVVFRPDPKTIQASLPQLVGPDSAQKTMLVHYQRFANTLSLRTLSIQKMVLTKRLAWSLTLSNGIRLLLGRNDIENRFNRFVRLYPSVIGKKFSSVKVIDLRYPNGFAVQLKS